jgi:hypothetical protein
LTFTLKNKKKKKVKILKFGDVLVKIWDYKTESEQYKTSTNLHQLKACSLWAKKGIYFALAHEYYFNISFSKYISRQDCKCRLQNWNGQLHLPFFLCPLFVSLIKVLIFFFWVGKSTNTLPINNNYEKSIVKT